jgi:hypothetical protein
MNCRISKSLQSIALKQIIQQGKAPSGEALVALRTGERLLLGMGSFMALQVLQPSEHALAAMALEALGFLIGKLLLNGDSLWRI